YQDSHVAGVIGTLFHVTPKGVARRIARDATQPAWSRAAGLLAYVSDDDGAPGISVRRGKAGRRIADSPLPSGAVVVGDPQWSRDGTLLALRVLDAEGTPSVAVLGAAGGPLRRMVAAPGAGWTAGHDLVYATAADEIRIVDVDTGAVRRVTTGSQVRPAPVGSLLAVEKGAWTLVRPDGTIVSRPPPRFYDPGWAPDGRRLAGLDHGRLVVVDLKGHERRLTAHAGEEARAPTWSPDGRLIA